MTHRLTRVCATCLRQQRLNNKYVDARKTPTIWTHVLRNFIMAPSSSDGNSDDPDATAPPGPADSHSSRRALLLGRRRPLSPLERVSQLLPQDSLSKEVWELREKKALDEAETEEQAQEVPTVGESQVEDDAVTQGEETERMEQMMQFGETLLAEYRRSRRVEFRKMFLLQEGAKLQSNWGFLPHQTIAGLPSGSVLRTSVGLPMLLRRPSLEEFTLFMKRGPAISYPKDISAMLMMMDVSEGDTVLESGSGSGAMSLFLSRAVGSRGRVLSVEVRKDHHRCSVLNYQRWRSTWKLRRGEEWPDNVHFHNSDVINSAHLLAGQSFHSIALDMVSPHLALPTVVPHLHSGAVCAVYLANITQIIDLMEGLRCSTLPLVCERIMEVQYRDWLLGPSLKKDGTFNQRKPMREETSEEDENSNDEENEEHTSPKQIPFGSVPYIARPHPEQFSHTAFLVKLRKILK
ncbi:tRNA (adenine(58)-N(1))-methyltransferase, mitochondrial [Astyanax mexicanus]|uniref:tRNA (adenine(58)-N(1))-methyltransferase, mitochondrial n=1 Tax=Astyanax mexicanus TaxID=7994 RepID=UPI0020CB3A36|nr:tRNA (adenine(58)-N(1))-methyltransferase, mitochondrial [Astyanax mexicanus]